jgi:hypothetical protein
MPDSVIQRVEALGQKAPANAFDFSDRYGILFEWNDEVDEHQERLVEEDPILYPSLVAKFPGVMLDRDIPIPSIEEEFAPQGRAKDVAAHNANIPPYAIAGVDRPAIVDIDDGKIEVYDNDNNNDGIIEVLDLPRDDDMDIRGHIELNDMEEEMYQLISNIRIFEVMERVSPYIRKWGFLGTHYFGSYGLF